MDKLSVTKLCLYDTKPQRKHKSTFVSPMFVFIIVGKIQIDLMKVKKGWERICA